MARPRGDVIAAHHVLDPGVERGDTGVDAGIPCESAALAPAHHADLPVFARRGLRHHRAAAVALTGVNAALRQARAKIAAIDLLSPVAIGLSALIDFDQRDVRLSQIGRFELRQVDLLVA